MEIKKNKLNIQEIASTRPDLILICLMSTLHNWYDHNIEKMICSAYIRVPTYSWYLY